MTAKKKEKPKSKIISAFDEYLAKLSKPPSPEAVAYAKKHDDVARDVIALAKKHGIVSFAFVGEETEVASKIEGHKTASNKYIMSQGDKRSNVFLLTATIRNILERFGS